MTEEDKAILKLISLAIQGARVESEYNNPVDAVHDVMTLCEIAGIIATELEVEV